MGVGRLGSPRRGRQIDGAAPAAAGGQASPRLVVANPQRSRRAQTIKPAPGRDRINPHVASHCPAVAPDLALGLMRPRPTAGVMERLALGRLPGRFVAPGLRLWLRHVARPGLLTVALFEGCRGAHVGRRCVCDVARCYRSQSADTHAFPTRELAGRAGNPRPKILNGVAIHPGPLPQIIGGEGEGNFIASALSTFATERRAHTQFI